MEPALAEVSQRGTEAAGTVGGQISRALHRLAHK
jgi:hypothetical protein